MGPACRWAALLGASFVEPSRPLTLPVFWRALLFVPPTVPPFGFFCWRSGCCFLSLLFLCVCFALSAFALCVLRFVFSLLVSLCGSAFHFIFPYCFAFCPLLVSSCLLSRLGFLLAAFSRSAVCFFLSAFLLAVVSCLCFLAVLWSCAFGFRVSKHAPPGLSRMSAAVPNAPGPWEQQAGSQKHQKPGEMPKADKK